MESSEERASPGPLLRLCADRVFEPQYRMAFACQQLWQNGREVRVRFLDGHPEVCRRVEAVACRWSEFANVRFGFIPEGQAEVRVAFRPGASWSCLGKDSLRVTDPDEETMNLGWLEPETEESEYERVVLHEFGHALGCIHEHASPGSEIPWDRPSVYRYYSEVMGWTTERVDANVFERYSETVTQFTRFDPESIMLYPIPKELTAGKLEVGWNCDLSTLDREFAGVIYPFPPERSPELRVGGAATVAHVFPTAPGDRFFHFIAPEAQQYGIEVEGRDDTTVTVFGPGWPSSVIAERYSTTGRPTAALRLRLRAGDYYLRLRHRKPAEAGAFRVRVESTG